MIRTFDFISKDASECITVKVDIGLSWDWCEWEYDILRCYKTDENGKEIDIEVTDKIEELIDNELAELEMPDRNDTDRDYDEMKDERSI